MKAYKDGFIWNFLSIGLQNLMQIITLVLLSRLLSPADFGVVAIAMIVVAVTQTLTQLGIPQALVQKQYLNKNETKLCFNLTLLIGIIGTLFLYLSSEYLSSFFNSKNKILEIILILLPIILFSSIFNFLEVFFLRNLNYKTPALINIISYSFGYGLVSIILANLNFEAKSIAYGHLAQNSLRLILIFFFIKNEISFTEKESNIISIFYFGIRQTISQLGILLSTNIDNIIIGKYSNLSELGNYTRAYSLMLLPSNLIGQVIDKTMFPFFSRIADDNHIRDKYFYKTLSFSLMISIPLTVFLYLSAQEIILVFLGEQWKNITPIFQIFCLGIIFRINYKINESLLRSAGKTKEIMIIQWIYVLLVLASSYVGIHYGIKGVALAVLCTIVIISIIFQSFSINVLNQKKSQKQTNKVVLILYTRHFFIGSIIYLIVSVVKYYLEMNINFPLIIQIFIMTICTFSVSLMIYISSPLLTNEEKKIITSMFKK